MTVQLVSFDALRVWDIPGVRHLKADTWTQEMETIRAADWLLFPGQSLYSFYLDFGIGSTIGVQNIVKPFT